MTPLGGAPQRRPEVLLKYCEFRDMLIGNCGNLLCFLVGMLLEIFRNCFSFLCLRVVVKGKRKEMMREQVFLCGAYAALTVKLNDVNHGK